MAITFPWFPWARTPPLPCHDFSGALLEAVQRGVFAIDIVSTSASAIARRMAAVGFVTVSLRRSIMPQ